MIQGKFTVLLNAKKDLEGCEAKTLFMDAILNCVIFTSLSRLCRFSVDEMTENSVARNITSLTSPRLP